MRLDAGRLGTAIVRKLGPHGKRATVLLSGTLVAQMIPIAASPILTRLYSASDFGLLAIFGAMTSIIVAVASGRYHMAITLPDDDKDAVQITTLSIVVAAGMCGLLVMIATIFYLWLPLPRAISALGAWLIIVPIASFLGSVYETLTYLCLRLDQLRNIATSGGLKAALGSLFQIVFGFLGFGTNGILAGNLVTVLAGNMSLVRRYVSFDPLRRVGWADLRRHAQRYSNFPKFDMWSILANVVGANTLIVGLTALYGITTVGHYALASRLLLVPASLVGATVGQVFLREISLRLNDPFAARRAFNKTAKFLILFSLIPFTILAFFAGDLFQVAFGSSWREAGLIAGALLPLVWVRFVVSPLTTTFTVYERQRQLFFWQISLLACTVLSFVAAAFENWTAIEMLRVYAWAQLALYLIMLFHSRSILLGLRRHES